MVHCFSSINCREWFNKYECDTDILNMLTNKDQIDVNRSFLNHGGDEITEFNNSEQYRKQYRTKLWRDYFINPYYQKLKMLHLYLWIVIIAHDTVSHWSIINCHWQKIHAFNKHALNLISGLHSKIHWLILQD